MDISFMKEEIDSYSAVLGEYAWHSLILDPDISENSEQHFRLIQEYIRKWLPKGPRRVLEVGAYAHYTAYLLADHYKAEATIFDLSASALRLGRKLAPVNNLSAEIVSGDFHDLPFTDDYFDLVYVFAALHHAKDFQMVAKELQRVLSPGGLLCLFQEPFEREACLYKFRTNRPHRFTSFEKSLEKEDILTTIAEPSLGSRDELLFGMIENQNISLPTFLDVITRASDLLELTPYYEGKIGELGELWLEWGALFGDDFEGLKNMVTADFLSRVERARPELDQVARGLGFSLPTEKEILELGRKVAGRVSILLGLKNSAEYDFQAAQLFGGSVCLAVRKMGEKDTALPMDDRCKFKEDYILQDGVRLTFPYRIRSLLNDATNAIPDFNAIDSAGMQEFFPIKFWQFKREDIGLRSVTLIGQKGELFLPATVGGHCLLLLRLNLEFNSEKFCPYKIKIDYGEIFEYSVYQAEAILFRKIIDLKNIAKILITVADISPTEENENLDGLVKIYYAGLFSL